MQTNRIIVIDTNSILNCPQVIDQAIDSYDKVYIPKVVINELNFQKDRGTPEKRKLAGLCLGKIIDNKSRIIRAESNCYGRNDDKIYFVAEETALNNANSKVYILTNDKDYKLKRKRDLSNLFIINSKDFMDDINNDSAYDYELSKDFYDAVNYGDIDSAKNLICDTINVNYVDGDTGYTPLIQAVRNKDYRMVHFLVNLNNIKLNEVDEKKYCLPAISHAIQMHNISLVRILIESGANVNAPSRNETNYFNTPLMIAAWSGDYEIVKLLVENGACINQVDRKNGFTALIKAAFKNEFSIAKYLVDAGADASIQSFEEKTALDYAKENHSTELIGILGGK